MTGEFVVVRPRFAFVRPDGANDNLFVGADAITALPRPPQRGDLVQFRVAETRDGRRRAIDLVLVAEARPQC